jgi:phospholipase/carboxylesterase
MPRFFRRLAEGVFDVADLHARTDELADFVTQARAAYHLEKPIAVGFSNGANVAASLLLRHPDLLAGAVLLRAMLPFDPAELPHLSGIPVLLVLGSADPMIPPESSKKLAQVLSAAGADLRTEILPAGHGLTPQDLALARAWLAARRGGGD